jgi:hypothetical protein
MFSWGRRSRSLSNFLSCGANSSFETLKKELRQFQWENHLRFVMLGLSAVKHGNQCCCADCEMFRESHSSCLNSWCDSGKVDISEWVQKCQDRRECE